MSCEVGEILIEGNSFAILARITGHNSRTGAFR